jgi:hypothetical protein
MGEREAAIGDGGRGARANEEARVRGGAVRARVTLSGLLVLSCASPQSPPPVPSPAPSTTPTPGPASGVDAAAAASECDGDAGSKLIARAEREVLDDACFPKEPNECARIASVHVVNCGATTRAIRVVRLRPDPWNLSLDVPPLAPGAATTLRLPLETTDGVVSFQIVAYDPDPPHDASTAGVTITVRDPAIAKGRAELCAELGDAGAPYKDTRAAVADEDPPPVPAGVTEIALIRHGCFGGCGAYAVRLRTDGTLDYRGFANVRFRGRVSGAIAPDAVQGLVRTFETLAKTAKPRPPGTHCAMPPDTPRHLMTLTRAGKTTELWIDQCHPQSHADLADAIDRAAGDERWVTGGKDCSMRLW